jgi:ubiquinone biosynthesis protein
MLARSLTTLEGVIEQLCPDLNIFDMLYDKLKERARQNMNIPRELFEKGQELVKAGKKAARIPLLASEVLEGMVKGKTKVRFELSGYEEPLNRIFHFLRYTVLTLVALVLFIGSCILCTTDFKPILPNGVPLLAVAGIVFSIALAIFSIKKLK